MMPAGSGVAGEGARDENTCFDGTFIRFYYDGSLIGTQYFSFVNTAAHTVKIGGYAESTDLQGNIADVRVWNHARGARHISVYRNRRLTGTEPGLVGYWPLDEGTGDTAFDNTGAGSDGTLNGVTWTTTETLNLVVPDPDWTHAMPFDLGNIKTGSTRFTNSNQVEVVAFPIPEGCDFYQMNDEPGVGSIDPGGWLPTNTQPGILTFDWPATDTNIVFYAWFTNSTATAEVHRATGEIFYTEAAPVPVTRAALTMQRMPGGTVVVTGADIDNGSSGGSANGVAMEIVAIEAAAATPADDLTPGEPYVTLATEGVYPLLLTAWNEAGNWAQAVSTCQVTVATYSGTNYWTGNGLDDRWHSAANWTAGVPVDGQDVAILAGNARLTAATASLNSFRLSTGRTLTVDGWESLLNATELRVEGTITHTANNVQFPDAAGNWVRQHRILLQGSNITIAAGAVIDADWKGYRVGQGPGTPFGSTGGAGHAGLGGHGDGAVGGPAYGDPFAPVVPGSGGGLHVNGAEGGGAIRIAADGQLTVHGTIRASGRTALGSHGGGGSGGSIWLSCRTLAGSAAGLVQAKGGNGNHYGGAGAGGRLAVAYDPAAQAALPDSRPAIRFDGTPGAPASQNREQLRAAMGTLALPDTRLVENDFTAKRLQYVQLMVADWTQWTHTSLTLDDCVVGLEEGIDVSVTQDLVLTNNGALHMFAAPVTNVLTDTGAALTVGGSLHVFEGSWIVPVAHPTNGAAVKIGVEADLLIAATGGIDADMRGYTRGFGPGVPYDSGGAGHGGHGGMGFGGKIFGHAYGEAEWPMLAGSAGRSATLAGRGGGAIRLHVGGRAVIDGTLTAKGGHGTTTHGPAGSGGSILVQCTTFEGSDNGRLAVDGGQGNYYGGCGGGGRIAIHYDAAAQAALQNPVPGVRFTGYAYPLTTYGTSFTIDAQMGTLWLPDLLFLTETLDKQRFWHVRLVVPDQATWTPADLTLDNCVLTWPEGFTLAVANDLILTNGAVMTLVAAATNAPAERYGTQVTVGRDLKVYADSWICPQAHPTNAAIAGLMVGRHATLASGGGIDADGRGYHASNVGEIGPGEGANGYQGGGYGGKGGGTAGGPAYGSAVLPLLPGSAAGWNGYGGANGYTVGGNGGGAVHLRVGGVLRVDGLITADGWHGSYYGGGGGSGGAVFLAARRLTGSGTVRANGGLSNLDVASGGGGRIAVWHHMPLGEVEARLASGMTSGLRYAATHPDFPADRLEVAWYGISKNGLPGAGTKGFYTAVSTLMLIR